MSDRDRADRVRPWFEGRPSGPFSIQLNPTMACNLNCLFCRRQDQLPDYYRHNKELSDEKYVEIVRDAVALGVRSINIKGGGEPLIRRRLFMRIVPMIAGAGVSGSLITNGTLLDEALAETFVAHGWEEISFSLDGPNAEVHDHLRDKKDTFARVVQALERLNRAKDRLKKQKPVLKFHCVLTNRSHLLMDDMLRLADLYRVTEVEWDSLNPVEPSSHGLVLSEKDLAAFQARLPVSIALGDRLKLRHNLRNFQKREYAMREAAPPVIPVASAPSPARAGADGPRAEVDRMQSVPCYFPWYHCSITPEGSIVPCCYGEGFKSKGNLHSLSFHEAWLNGAMGEYRESMLDGSMKPFCKGCTALYMDQNVRVRQALAASPALA